MPSQSAIPHSQHSSHADGHLSMSGMVRLDDVGEALNLELRHPEIDTVSGLVLTLLGRPPVVGNAVNYENLRFEVVEIAGNGVRECHVTPIVSVSDESEMS